MRRALALLLLLAASARAADIPVTVDPRLETLGIVQMLAVGKAQDARGGPSGGRTRPA